MPTGTNSIPVMICINRKKDVMKKGFTLVELIAVISIMSVILLIGIPTYTYINNKMKENLYTSKVNELLAKGSVYAEETGLFAFSVNTLVEEGKISPDNESGQILDPRDQRKMNCDIIRVVYENNQYEASYAMSDACLSDEELNNQYGMFQIIVKNKDGDVVSDYDTWHNITEYYLSYELKEEYQNFASNILSVTWSGEGDKTCSIDNLAECDTYLVSATSVKRTTIVLKIEMNINESRLSTTYKVNLQMDNESPILVPGSMNYDNTIPTTEKRKVTFELSDNLGSGVSSYSLSPNKECDNYKESSDGLQTEYLDNGEYYLCVKDNVGLETSYFDDNDKIVITNVDNKDLTIYLTNSSSGTWAKNNVDINVISNKDKMDFCLYKYDNNEYARYNKSFISSKLILDSITEEQDQKLTLVCYDAAGNSSNEVSTNVKIDKTGPTISYAVVSSTAGTSGWYKKLQLKVTLADSKSGVSSAKYCTTTSSSCTPTTGVTLTNNTFNINIPNGKQVLCTTATDKVGNSTTKCSSAYSVDGSNPSVSYSIVSKTTGENGWYKALSIKASLSDSTSGVRTAKYCETGSSTCTPSANATISSNAFNVSLSNGSNRKVCVNVTDWAGNTSGTTCSSAYSIDNVAPTVGINTSSSGKNVTVTATNAKDNLSGIASYEYKKDSDAWISSTSSKYTYTNLTDGTHTFYVRVKDKAGNYSSSQSSSVKIVTEGPDDYNWSKSVACDKTKFQNIIDTGKFESYINYQAFRNAMYDCSSVTSGVLKNSSTAYNILRNSSRTKLISGSGKAASYTWKNSSSSVCTKAICMDPRSNYASSLIYNGKVLVLSASTNTSLPKYGTKKSHCIENGGFGNCDNSGDRWWTMGKYNIWVCDTNNNCSKASGWGYCTKTNNGNVNLEDCPSSINRSALFVNGVKVALYGVQEWHTDSGSGDKDYIKYSDGMVYVQIFVI